MPHRGGKVWLVMNEDEKTGRELMREESDGRVLDRCVQRMVDLHETPGRRQDELMKRHVAETIILMMMADHQMSPTLSRMDQNNLAILIHGKYRAKMLAKWAEQETKYCLELWSRMKQEAEEKEAARRLLFGP